MHHLEDVVDVPNADCLVDGVGDEDVVAALLHQLHLQDAAGMRLERPESYVRYIVFMYLRRLREPTLP